MPKKKEEKPKITRSVAHNLEAEQSALGCILYDADAAADILPELRPEDFYAESHRLIFEAMQEVYNRNQPVDMVTLTDAMEQKGTLSAAGGLTYLSSIATSVPSAANFRYYVDIVNRDSVLRRLERAASDIAEMVHTNITKQDALAYAEKAVFDISAETDASQLTGITDSLTNIFVKFEQLATDKDAFKGMKTGFTQLDDILNGLHRTDLVLIAARPAMGKSSFAMNIVENLALAGRICAVFSLEMPKDQVVQRMLCSAARVSLQKASKGKLEEKDWTNLWQANNQLSKAKVFIDDSSMTTPADILSKCRRLKAREGGLDCVMVDYLQLMTNGKKTDNRQQEVAEISRTLKIIAKELDVPVLALSQLSRAVESRTSHRPQLSDLRESGSIEQDADIVMFIHRPDRAAENESAALSGAIEKDLVEIIIAKHRNGPTGSIALGWTGEYTRFENTDKTADQLLAAYGSQEAPKYRRREDQAPPPESAPPAGEPPPPDEVPAEAAAASEPPPEELPWNG